MRRPPYPRGPRRRRSYGCLEVVPLTLARANDLVEAHHRHHGRVIGHRFSLGLEAGGDLVGAAIVGRPVARCLDDGKTAEVVRLVVQPRIPNGCSKLYGAAWRAWRAMGGRRLVTYTLADEPGTSLRASGARLAARVKGRSWNCPSRPREDKHPLADKLRWEWLVAPPEADSS